MVFIWERNVSSVFWVWKHCEVEAGGGGGEGWSRFSLQARSGGGEGGGVEGGCSMDSQEVSCTRRESGPPITVQWPAVGITESSQFTGLIT